MERLFLSAASLFLLLFLLLTGSACSVKKGLPGATGQIGLPVLSRPLTSPLLSHANSLNVTDPDRNYAMILDVGSEALLARIHLIRSATESIAIQTLIWVNDEAGRLVMYELIQAARRGVTVQLLIDHIASEQHVEAAAFLASVHPNLEVRLYNPVAGLTGRPMAEPSMFDTLFALLFKFKRFNQRMHNKTFMVDDLIGITGGRNYQDAYFDHAGGMNYKDRDILVIGPVVREMKTSFLDYWNFDLSVSLERLTDVRRQEKRGKVKFWATRESFRIDELSGKIDADTANDDLIGERFLEPLTELESAYFVADDPGKREHNPTGKDGASRITLELAGLVARAEKSIYIQTPYLVLTPAAINLFRSIRKESPEIDISISTNSLAATDSWHVYALSYKQMQTYLQTLCFRIYEFKPVPADLSLLAPDLAGRDPAKLPLSGQKDVFATAMAVSDSRLTRPSGPALPEPAPDDAPYLSLHAKSMVIDDEVSFIGSYNLDPRSERLNTEAGLVIRDKKLARLLRESIRRDMAPRNSWVIAKRQIPLGIDHLNAVIAKVSDLLPLIDIWPFRYSASFELVEGGQVVDIEHQDFYENYRNVGSFPDVEGDAAGKVLGARGTKAFLSFVKPLL